MRVPDFKVHSEIRRAAYVLYGRDPYRSYIEHKSKAASRGIGFAMDFPTWWQHWEPHFGNIGRRRGQMSMCRTADAGGYEDGNVRIDTVTGNHVERQRLQTYRKIDEEWGEAASSADWLSNRRDNGYFSDDD